MNQASPIEARYTHSRGSVGLSAAHPVSVRSYIIFKQDGPDVVGGSADTYGIPMGYVIPVAAERVLPHDHAYYETSLFLSGHALHKTSTYERDVQSGMVIVVPPGAVHAFEYFPGPPVVQINVYFLAEWFLDEIGSFWQEEGLVPLFFSGLLFKKPVFDHVPQFKVPADVFAQCLSDLDDILVEFKHENSSMAFVKSSFLRFLVRLSRAYVQEEPSYAFLPFRDEVMTAIAHIERAIEQGEPFHVAETAHKLGVSKEHFSRLFRSATGWSPLDYFQRRRVQKASRLLLDHRVSITNVVHAMGYFDSSHFCHKFRRYLGMTPREFRKRYGTHGPSLNHNTEVSPFQHQTPGPDPYSVEAE